MLPLLWAQAHLAYRESSVISPLPPLWIWKLPSRKPESQGGGDCGTDLEENVCKQDGARLSMKHSGVKKRNVYRNARDFFRIHSHQSPPFGRASSKLREEGCKPSTTQINQPNQRKVKNKTKQKIKTSHQNANNIQLAGCWKTLERIFSGAQ